MLNVAWVEISGIIAALGIIWYRLKAWDFEKSLLMSRQVWAAVATGVIGVFQAMNLDVKEIQGAIDAVFVAGPALAMVLGSIGGIIGRKNATAPVLVADPVRALAVVGEKHLIPATVGNVGDTFRKIPGVNWLLSLLLSRASWSSLVSVIAWLIQRLSRVTKEQWQVVLDLILEAERTDRDGAQKLNYVLGKLATMFPHWNSHMAQTVVNLGLWVLGHEGRVHLRVLDGTIRLGIIEEGEE